MDEVMRTKLLLIREQLLAEGVVIVGIFGSRARGDFRPNSDLDILYRLEDAFYEKNSSWGGVGRIEEIRNEIEALLGLAVDLADLDALRQGARDSILPEIIYVA